MTIAVDHETPGLPPGLMPPPWAPDCWDDQDQTELVCRTVLDITHDVKTFMFAAEGDKVFHFEPGQFITLQLEIDGQPISRCYTISSPPTRPHLIAITVKRVIEGPVSNWLHDNVVPGTRITVLAPLGQFTISGSPEPKTKYLFLSAGSGITPLMSMTRTLFDLGSDADILFVHAARTPADIIFRRELEAIAAVAPNIQVINICETDYPSERWTGLRGRLTGAALQAIAPDLDERITYTCGPPPYMAAVRRILGEAGYDMAKYNEESFSFESLPVAEQAAADPLHLADEADGTTSTADADVKTFDVEFVRSGRTVTVSADQFVLDAAVAAGMRLPSSCTQGMCGTCKSTMLDGSVDMQHNGGIRPKEIAQNKILICCSKPLSDLRIEA